MSKFTTPVSMQVTQEQYEKDLKEPLLKLGYKENSMWGEDYPDLFAGYNEPKELNYLNREFFPDAYQMAYYINTYNPTLFLALAAMSNEKDGIAGEYWVCTYGNEGVGFKFGNIYKSARPINECSALITDLGDENGWQGQTHVYFRKATKEELINHFTKENVFSTNKTDMKKDTIIGYKLTKPEYVEAVNKISNYTHSTLESNCKFEGCHFRYDSPLHQKLLNLGLMIWCEPVYKQEEQIFKVGNFEVKVKDGKVFHCGDDITQFTIGLINHFKPQKFGGYLMQVEDVTFSRTGCQTTSKLSEWLEVFKALNK